MISNKYEKYIILSLAFYFGWLLSFPFYGHILYLSVANHQVDGLYLGLIFTFLHAISFIMGGFFFKNIYNWKKLMLVSLLATIIINISLLILDLSFWPVAMGLLGITSSLYILGWSCIYSMYIPSTGRIKKIALIIIISNVIFVTINWVSSTFSSSILLAIAVLPLLASLAVLLKIPSDLRLEYNSGKKDVLAMPTPLILIFCFFVAGLYLNGGFMYTIILPSFEKGLPFFGNYKFVPYIAVLLVMYKFGERVQHYLPVYMGVTLLGMAFVSFALLSENIVGLLVTLTLVEASFAFLDLFVWAVIGNLAFIYGVPYQFFGFVLGSMVFSILAGDIIGSQIIQVGEAHRMVTAIFAAAAIFLTYTVMPWLNQRMNKDFTEMIATTVEENTPKKDENLFETLLTQLLTGHSLTPRELEITRLILKGLKNKEIAEQLFISDNTLKSHLRNIYPKFGVSQKRELLSMAISIKRNKFITSTGTSNKKE